MGPNFNCDLSLGLWCDPLKIMYTSLIRLFFHIMCDDNTNYSLRLFSDYCFFLLHIKIDLLRQCSISEGMAMTNVIQYMVGMTKCTCSTYM